MKKYALLIAMFLLSCSATFAQCAMCRTSLENNFSNGSPGIAAGINTGILYLLAMPYLAAVTIGYLWYKRTKTHGRA
jgi:hypothetical protein